MLDVFICLIYFVIVFSLIRMVFVKIGNIEKGVVYFYIFDVYFVELFLDEICSFVKLIDWKKILFYIRLDLEKVCFMILKFKGIVLIINNEIFFDNFEKIEKEKEKEKLEVR